MRLKSHFSSKSDGLLPLDYTDEIPHGFKAGAFFCSHRILCRYKKTAAMSKGTPLKEAIYISA
jgi:hypothetical protein